MLVLRCTKKLLDRLGGIAALAGATSTSTTKLGDWTANLVIVRRQQLVLGVSGLTLLPVLLPLAPSKTLLARFPEAVGQVLAALGIDGKKIAAELEGMAECTVATTNDRRILGSMNDFTKALEWYLDGRTLEGAALHLAETPCSPIGMQSPERATLALFAAPTLRLVKR